MNAASGQLKPHGRVELGDYPVDAAWSPDGRSVLVACGDGALNLVAIDGGQSVRRIGEHGGGVLAVAWQ